MVHSDTEELLALSSLGLLDEQEKSVLRHILTRAVDCRGERKCLAILLKDIAALLAYLPTQRRAPAGLKERIFCEIARRAALRRGL